MSDNWLEELFAPGWDNVLEPTEEEFEELFDWWEKPKPRTIFMPQEIGPVKVNSSNVRWLKYTSITEYEGLLTIKFWWGGEYEYYVTIDVFEEIAYHTNSPGRSVWNLLRR